MSPTSVIPLCTRFTPIPDSLRVAQCAQTRCPWRTSTTAASGGDGFAKIRTRARQRGGCAKIPNCASMLHLPANGTRNAQLLSSRAGATRSATCVSLVEASARIARSTKIATIWRAYAVSVREGDAPEARLASRLHIMCRSHARVSRATACTPTAARLPRLLEALSTRECALLTSMRERSTRVAGRCETSERFKKSARPSKTGKRKTAPRSTSTSNRRRGIGWMCALLGTSSTSRGGKCARQRR
jgi:hypothetical protein